MFGFLLADAVEHVEKIQKEDVLYLIFLGLLAVPFLIVLLWLMRRLRTSQDSMKIALDQNEEQLKLLSRACECSEVGQRHLAAIEARLDQIHDELKRRPLS